MSTKRYTTSQVATQLGFTPAYVRELTIKHGVDASERTAGGQRRFTDEDVNRLRAALSGHKASPHEVLGLQSRDPYSVRVLTIHANKLYDSWERIRMGTRMRSPRSSRTFCRASWNP